MLGLAQPALLSSPLIILHPPAHPQNIDCSSSGSAKSVLESVGVSSHGAKFLQGLLSTMTVSANESISYMTDGMMMDRKEWTAAVSQQSGSVEASHIN